MPISGVNTGAAQPVTGVDKVSGAPRAQKTGAETAGRPLRPVMDEYIPEEKQEPSGRYWVGRDENGQPRIYFDDPERAAETPQGPESVPDAGGPEKGGEERYACDTGKVDREIDRLKKRRQELEQRLNTETDETKIKELEHQLAQVEQELKQKDNDTYRRQHSRVTRLS